MRFLIRHDGLNKQYLDDVSAMVLTGAANNCSISARRPRWPLQRAGSLPLTSSPFDV